MEDALFFQNMFDALCLVVRVPKFACYSKLYLGKRKFRTWIIMVEGA